MQHKRLWVALTIVIAGSFAILGGVGYDALHKAPPIPGRVIAGIAIPLFYAAGLMYGQRSHIVRVRETPGRVSERTMNEVGMRYLVRGRDLDFAATFG
jgi:nitric oxide reductase large subunit